MPKGESLQARFWSKVKRGPKCWEWIGYKTPQGYGAFSINGKSRPAHRVSWELHKGPISDGAIVMHECDHPWCVNPAHLSAGTQSDNMQECSHRGRAGLQKISANQARKIRKLYATGGYSYRGLAKQFGVSRQTIMQIVRRQTHKA